VNSYFEEVMASTFGEEKSVDTHISTNRSKQLKTGEPGKHKEIKRIQAERMKKKLRIAFGNFDRLKSLSCEMAVLKLGKI